MIDLVFWSFSLALAPMAMGLAWKLIFGAWHWIALELSRAFEGAEQAASDPLSLDSPSQAGEWIRMAFQAVAPHCDASGRLIEYFSRAGLPQPILFCEARVDGGKDSLLYALDGGHPGERHAATRQDANPERGHDRHRDV